MHGGQEHEVSTLGGMALMWPQLLGLAGISSNPGANESNHKAALLSAWLSKRDFPPPGELLLYLAMQVACSHFLKLPWPVFGYFRITAPLLLR